MKTLLAVIVTSLIGTSAMAATGIACKERSVAQGQGYEVFINGTQAAVYENGRFVATLAYTGKQPSRGGDQQAETNFSENLVNGLTMKLLTGGLSGRPEVRLFHGGFAGNSLIAILNECI